MTEPEKKEEPKKEAEKKKEVPPPAKVAEMVEKTPAANDRPIGMVESDHA